MADPEHRWTFPVTGEAYERHEALRHTEVRTQRGQPGSDLPVRRGDRVTGGQSVCRGAVEGLARRSGRDCRIFSRQMLEVSICCTSS